VHAVRDRITPTAKELEKYERYRDTPNGVSPMSIPGMKKGMYQTNGLEHDVEGQPSSNYLTHETMNAKRYRKMWPIRDRYHGFRRFGPERAEVGVLCWGSSKGPVQDAVAAANVLFEPLREGQLAIEHLRRIQKRREWPTRVTQGLQVAVQRRIIARVLVETGPLKPPLAVRLLAKIPYLRRVPARIVGLGIRPEHVDPALAQE